ncbi:hypothetical protein, partial [Bacteroides uniformis]|uniref:hypothetical protein n=1 Tax=Bacteroides uniformis TaxID=820 RepID=UPI0039B55BBE
ASSSGCLKKLKTNLHGKRKQGKIKIDILFQPIIRDIHIIIFLLFPKVTCKGNKIFWLAGNYK